MPRNAKANLMLGKMSWSVELWVRGFRSASKGTGGSEVLQFLLFRFEPLLGSVYLELLFDEHPEV